MEDVVAVLRVNGKIPRRAVLKNGVLHDKTTCPGEQETVLLSRLCEIARASAGLPVHPRSTADLLESALADNCPTAWSAIRDDILTNDLDVDVAASVLCHNSNASAMIACLVGATGDDHLLHVACLLARVIDKLPEEARDEMGRSLACQMKAVMGALARGGALMSRDVRDAVINGFGRILQKTGLTDSRTAELILYSLTSKHDELLRLFLHVSPGYLHHRPQILPLLLDHAKTAPPTSKFPPLAMLARVVADFPEAVQGHEKEVCDIVCSALPHGQQLDCRECMAAASLLVASGDGVAGGVASALVRALAVALQRACATLLLAEDTSSS